MQVILFAETVWFWVWVGGFMVLGGSCCVELGVCIDWLGLIVCVFDCLDILC